MLTATIHQIDFIDTAGTATRLLTAGDLVTDEPDFQVQQQGDSQSALGRIWGTGVGMGGARRSGTFTRILEHASHAAAAAYCIRWPATLPLARSGKLRITITGGEVWDLADAIITTCGCRRSTDGLFATAATLQLTAGEATPVSGVAFYTGMPAGWVPETHGAIARTHAAG